MVENRINFVINSLDPYQYEVINLLALPNGARFRFRYQSKWIDRNCFTEGLLNEKLLGYVFFNHASKFIENTEKEFSEYYPLRKIRYISHEEIGSICYFECELMDYFSYPLSNFIGSDNNKKINDSLVRADNALVFIDSAERELNCIDANTPGINIQNKNWVRTVEALSTVSALGKMDFYRISGIHCTSSADDSVINNTDGLYNLNESNCYEIILTQWRKESKVSVQSQTEKRGVRIIENPHIIPTQSFAMSLGKYDILKLAITLPTVNFRTKSFFQIDYFVEEKLRSLVDNSIRIPIVINKMPVSIKWQVGFILSAVFTYFVPNIFPLVSDFVNPDYCRDLSIIAATITLVDLFAIVRKKQWL